MRRKETTSSGGTNCRIVAKNLANLCQEFVGELCTLADKAYPDWEPKQRLEMARNQFVQGVASAYIQLVLMREKPKTVEEALELAQRQLAVETAQRQLHQRLPEAVELPVGAINYTNPKSQQDKCW